MPSSVLELKNPMLSDLMSEMAKTPLSPESSGCEMDQKKLGVLLEDPPIAIWATETASRYAISPLRALELFADALIRDAATKTV
jgi:hypothetical protein